MTINGPTSTLPGHLWPAEPGDMCAEHPSRQAVKKIQTETDSFGFETLEVCQECLDNYHKTRAEKLANPDPEDFFDCEGCSVRDKTVKPARDPEEGMAGPVYYWCAECRKDIFSRWSD